MFLIGYLTAGTAFYIVSGDSWGEKDLINGE